MQHIAFSLSACARVVSTWFLLGRVPRAPGTVGSASALLFFPAIASGAGCGVFLAAGIFFLGLWSVTLYLRDNPEERDPAEIVIDEVCGQVLVFVIPSALAQGGVAFVHLPSGMLHKAVLLCMGFLSFRIFDIAKPWPVCVADTRVSGALGVMLDDVVAAVLASIVCLAVASAVSTV
ncbi:phosphatidylglycerophosphatase A family protein [Anaplasma capra]|uniref:phosphatidylglycerophosphatase A family protein n=1 Tax=Anaplasma capra TaxID=1562740 RepID=UPI0021D5AAB5|nr:phosphatidylglycerophosphatase A [Anaplasma capra]MCU7611363.1 phosphatidylglycerophosphatase A [Anaplasma capra]MCU7612437.1 phosphatidylglycerophosphatase A [Anaplasma capra]